MAQRTGSRALFDFSTMGAEDLHAFLQTADPAGQVSDIKISAAALMNPSTGQLLKETGVRNLWVECQPRFFPGNPSAWLQRLRTLSEDYRCFPIVGDVSLLAAMVKEMKLKAQASILGDTLRVVSKDRDTLQQIMAKLRAADFGVALQFTNYRN